MNKIKIVHITSSLRCGGAEQVLVTLIEGLQDTFEQTVIFVHDGPNRAKIEALGVRCFQVRGFFSTYDPAIIYRLYILLYAIKPDIIHTLLWAATIIGRSVGRMLHIPVVTVYHGNVDQQGICRNILDRLTIAWSKINCAVSAGVAQSIHRLLADCSIKVIHNGIAVRSTVAHTMKHADIGCTPHHIIVGAVGRLVPLKRFDMLIDAIARIRLSLPQIRLCLIGDGPALAALRKQASACGVADSVLFMGAQQAVDYYHLFDCFVLPSPREGISIALLEAMYAEVPSIVVCQEGEHPVIQHGIHGQVLAQHSVEALVSAVNRVIYDSEWSQAAAKQGAERVRNCFNNNFMCAEYAKMFHAAIEE